MFPFKYIFEKETMSLPMDMRILDQAAVEEDPNNRSVNAFIPVYSGDTTSYPKIIILWWIT